MWLVGVAPALRIRKQREQAASSSAPQHFQSRHSTSAGAMNELFATCTRPLFPARGRRAVPSLVTPRPPGPPSRCVLLWIMRRSIGTNSASMIAAWAGGCFQGKTPASAAGGGNSGATARQADLRAPMPNSTPASGRCQIDLSVAALRLNPASHRLLTRRHPSRKASPAPLPVLHTRLTSAALPTSTRRWTASRPSLTAICSSWRGRCREGAPLDTHSCRCLCV